MTPNALINPVLPGFHPDPSILRVGSDFYLATINSLKGGSANVT